MVDIHCHILPAFDDGASDINESLAMVRLALDSGVDTIVTTPHFRGEEAAMRTIPRLISRYEQLTREAELEKLPIRLILGAEILCLPETAELARQKRLPTLGDTDYVLVEFFFDEPLEFMEEMLSAIEGAGYKPVIAHPERYEAVQAEPMAILRWFHRGYVLQLNKGSVLGAFGPDPEQTAHWALERGLAHIIASDAHGPRRRTTDMTQLAEYLPQVYPGPYARILLEQNPRRLIRNLPMEPFF